MTNVRFGAHPYDDDMSGDGILARWYARRWRGFHAGAGRVMQAKAATICCVVRRKAAPQPMTKMPKPR